MRILSGLTESTEHPSTAASPGATRAPTSSPKQLPVSVWGIFQVHDPIATLGNMGPEYLPKDTIAILGEWDSDTLGPHSRLVRRRPSGHARQGQAPVHLRILDAAAVYWVRRQSPQSY